MRRYRAIIRRSGVRPQRALEVGGLTGADSLLRFPELAGADRYCVNLRELPSRDGVTAVKGNANDMRSLFRSNWFDLVLCSSTLEHDKRFWRSAAEMRRVLRPGGLLIISFPGYVKDPENDRGRATLTYHVHYSFDFYRFSEQAVRQVFFESMERVRVRSFMTPPRIFGHGYKPLPPSRSVQALTLARRTAGRARRVALRSRKRLG
jgi:ubiquinone/menaquinone biosynthesis C-methylase UbiE